MQTPPIIATDMPVLAVLVPEPAPTGPGRSVKPVHDPAPPIPQPRGGKTLLNVLFAVQLLLGFLWTFPLLCTSGNETGWAGFYLFIFIYPVHFVIAMIACWSFWKRPETRKKAIVTLLTPAVLFFLPIVLIAIFGNGNPVLDSPEKQRNALAAVALLPVVFCLLFPRRAAEYIPRFVLRSLWLNVLILLVPLLVYAPVVLLFLNRNSIAGDFSGESAGMGLAYGALFLFMYFLVACVPVLFTFLYSYVGLFQSYDRRRHKLRIAQLVLSSPTVAIGGFVTFMLFTRGMPGG